MTGADDVELLARMARGSAAEARAALAELYERHAADVERFARRLLPGESDVMDCVHETFLSAARHAAAFRRGSALPWLLTLAGRRARDELRKRRRRRRREERVARAEASAAPPGPAGLEEQLARLPAQERAALELRFVDGLEHEAVARVLGVSLRTAKEWSKRGLEALRARMGDWQP